MQPTPSRRRRFAAALGGLCTLLASSGARAAPCDAPIEGIAIPPSWARTVDAGIVSYRSPAPSQAVTTATYAYRLPMDRGDRLALMRRAMSLDVDAERRSAGSGLVLAPIAQFTQEGALQLCQSGADRRHGMQFIRVLVATPRVLRSVRYEASGLSGEHFQALAAQVLRRRLAPVAALQPPGLPRPAALAAPALPLPLLRLR